VTAQLLDAKDGTHLWAETYDRALSASSIFAVQDEITEQVVATIASGFGVISRSRFCEIKGKPTDQLDAYECVLQLSAYQSAPRPLEHARLRDALERVVKSDPSYAEAWASLCDIYLDEHRFDYNPRPNSLDRALEAAQRAVALDPTSQQAHHALANVYFSRHELDGALAETERAIALNPNDASLLGASGFSLHFAGDERGIDFVKKSMALDPFHSTWSYLPIASYHFHRGEYEEALAAVRKVNLPGVPWSLAYLAAIYAELGRRDEAQSAVEELLRLDPGATTEKAIETARGVNAPDDRIRRWVAALRKAGLPD
jgi:adenylate cyclase